MDYKSIYSSLIELRKATPATGYTERHHVLPRCMGGTDVADNLVVLTGREHWVAHLLLYKIHKSTKLLYACHMMAMRCEERGIPRIKSSRMYEAIRKTHAELMGKHNKKNTGSNNSQYGTRWISNEKLRKSQKIKHLAPLPDGWEYGRDIWKSTKRRKDYSGALNQSKHAIKINALYRDLKSLRGITLKEFKIRHGIENDSNLIRKFERHILDFDKTLIITERDVKNIEASEKYRNLFERFQQGNYRSIREFYRKESLDVTVQALCRGFRVFVPYYTTQVKPKSAFNKKGREPNIG